MTKLFIFALALTTVTSQAMANCSKVCRSADTGLSIEICQKKGSSKLEVKEDGQSYTKIKFGEDESGVWISGVNLANEDFILALKDDKSAELSIYFNDRLMDQTSLKCSDKK